MADTFNKFVDKERARLTKERERLRGEQKALVGKLDALQRELAAIDAYETARKGSSVRVAVKRGRRSSKRAGILELLKGGGPGFSRGEILQKMGLKGDKAGEQSVSNALNALKKAGAVVAKDRKYRLSA